MAQLPMTRRERFQQLYDESYDDLWRYCRRRTANEADANDVVAEVMAVAWRRLSDVPAPPGARPWLFGVARNHLRSSRRKTDRRDSLTRKLQQQGSFTTQLRSDDAERLDVVAAALDQLDEPDRELIHLVAWDGLSHREIADLLAISENAVAIRLHRARGRLAQNVEQLQDLDQRRRQRFLPGVIAAALMLIAGSVLFAVSRAPSAEAVLMQAVARTTQFDSGRAEVDVEIRQPFPLGDFTLDYAFEGEDFRLDTVVGGVVGISQLGVGGRRYLGNASGSSELVWSDETDFPFPGGFLGGLSAADADPETVLPLLGLANDFDVTETADGEIYRGTISRADLLAQPVVPAGIALVTTGSDPASELPETMVVEVTVVDDLIWQLTLVVEGDVPAGEFVSATITTTYSEYGEPQNLSAPAAEDLQEGPFLQDSTDLQGDPGQQDDPPEVVAVPLDAALPIWAPGPNPQTATEVTLAEVLQRRPQLCFDAGRSPSPRVVDQQFYDEIRVSVVACFMGAGELDAANAIGAMSFGE